MSVRHFGRSVEGKSSPVQFSSWKALSQDIDTLANHPGLKEYRERLAKDCADRDNNVVNGVYMAPDILKLLDLPSSTLYGFSKKFTPYNLYQFLGVNGTGFWIDYIPEEKAGFSYFSTMKISSPPCDEVLAEFQIVRTVPNKYKTGNGDDYKLRQVSAFGKITCAQLSGILRRLSN
jgi:hypothetical protein